MPKLMIIASRTKPSKFIHAINRKILTIGASEVNSDSFSSRIYLPHKDGKNPKKVLTVRYKTTVDMAALIFWHILLQNDDTIRLAQE